jgi:hypothetical protein
MCLYIQHDLGEVMNASPSGKRREIEKNFLIALDFHIQGVVHWGFRPMRAMKPAIFFAQDEEVQGNQGYTSLCI